jgi:hypothetical protein
MMDELSFNWSKRLLAALESIAKSLEKIAEGGGCGCHGSDAPLVAVGAPPEEKMCESPTDYAQLAVDGKRDVLLALCAKRNIEVKPRTKTPTLAKLLTDADMVEAVNKNSEKPSQTEGYTEIIQKEGEAPDPFSEKTETEEVPDPFADPVVKTEAEPITRDVVLKAMQQVQKAEGNTMVAEILKKHAGVESFGALTEDNYAAVKAAADKVLG